MSNGLMHTFTGQKFYPLNPDIDTIVLEDIAHSLAHKCRYNGHTSEFYSVAQHSVLVSRAAASHKLAALFHDAAEAYLPDVSRHIKDLLNGYKEVEERLEAMIAEKFGYEYPYNEEVIRCDNAILRDEVLALFPSYSISDWPYISTVQPLGIEVHPWSPAQAESEFLNEAKKLFLSGA